MSYDSDALAGFDEWFGRILAGLSPGKRKRAAVKLGQALRRSNLKRITANVEPDGKPMEARKPRRDRRGRLKKKRGGKMFRELRYARRWRIDARTDSVELSPKAGANVAAIHHFGKLGTVGKGRDGKPIKYKYPARRLLGFDDEDRRAALDVAAELLDPGAG
ncbi:phage virion morphogenesis protein [Pelagerythrobacter sp.]|uniref:phage virion morphogenesis protein n=1 Tax=Pelagerythrobacter sp. TaxID=2800702 RepID=UPI0035B451F7